MPLNELERHPYLDYFKSMEKETLYFSNGMIIGSFPIYGCTDSIDKNLQILSRRFTKSEVKMRFFYGSRKSDFWKYVSSAFYESDPTKANVNPRELHFKCIEFLQRNNLVLTDVIYQTNRKDESSEDTSLMVINSFVSEWIRNNLRLNYGLIHILDDHPEIQTLYFTSQEINGNSPFGWFKRIFGKRLQIIEFRNFGALVKIDDKVFKCFFLPTPKQRALHFTDNQRSVLFVNFMKSYNPDFFQIIREIRKNERTADQVKRLSELRVECLNEAYRQAILYNNLDFDGTV
jgi:hypothetical protein